METCGRSYHLPIYVSVMIELRQTQTQKPPLISRVKTQGSCLRSEMAADNLHFLNKEAKRSESGGGNINICPVETNLLTPNHKNLNFPDITGSQRAK